MTQKPKCIILFLCPHIPSLRKWGSLTFHRQRLKEREKLGGEVENINGVKSAYIKAIR